MTTTSPQGKPEEKKKEARPGLTDNYTPAANVLIQGFSELSISERYVAIGLVSLYWDEKVYPVSLRELAAKIQVDHTTLRSRAGKRPAEGILDKLWRLGIIGLLEGKPINETGNKGRVQTYLRVNHRFIAERNSDCTQGKKAKTPRYTVGITNSSRDETTVGDTNHTVGDTNHTVGDTNHTVVHACVKSPHKNSNTSQEREESFSDGESGSYSRRSEQPEMPEKKGPSMAEWFAELDAKMDALDAEYSSRLQEDKAHQYTNPTLFQESVPAKSVAPKVVFNDMTKDLLQRDNRPPTPAEQKRIDDKERRERAQQVRKRTEELWLLFDRLFKSRVNRYGYNKPQVEELALNDLAKDEIIEKAFEAVAKSDAVKKDPTRLSITNIAIAVPSFIRVEQIKVVQANQPKEETALEKIRREERECAMRLQAQARQKEMAQ